MQRLVDNVLGIAKESIKTFSHESFNNSLRLINSFFGFILAVLPAKSSLAGIQGWELYPMLRGPRLPSWMEEGVSSFNAFIHEHESDEEFGNDLDDGSSVYDDAGSSPNSPSSSQASPNPQTNSSKRGRRKQNSILKRTLRKLLFPLRILCSGEFQTRPTPRIRSSTRSSTQKDLSEGEVQTTRELASDSSPPSLHHMYNIVAKSHLISGVKDYVVPKNTGDRRRGIIEDLQILVELSIERIFEVVRGFIQICFSPLAILNLIFNKLKANQLVDDATSTLGDSDPTPHKQQVCRGQTLNTDGRTCKDIISSLGYPYESMRVTTGDGHILLLERIPRPESRKVLYLQHGLLDSSLGWVSNGVVGSQAFAAYDQGYDVFLGNFRGLVSKEHVNQHISSRRYWQFSVNEHGTQDIPAMLSKVHEIKMNDLKQPRDVHNMSDISSTTKCIGEEDEEHELPYAMCGVAHSLGGASILMYVVTRRLEKKPHYLSRLVLLSPAGFHEDGPTFCTILRYIIPMLAPIMGPLVPGLYIPTQTCRALFNKLARDFQTYPALGGLVQIAISSLVGGDSSNWVGAIGMSHYNMNDMPGVSFLVAVHLMQMMRAKRFTMFDFGSHRTNLDAYGLPEPLDIGAHYGVIDIPVDVVAGVKDKLIPPSMVSRHYRTLKEAGCTTSYAEFEYAHLDFTFSHSEELLAYIMSRLSLVALEATPPLMFTSIQDTQDKLQPKTFKSRSLRKLNSIFMKSSKKRKGDEAAYEVEAVRDVNAKRKSQGLEGQTGCDLITGYWNTPSEVLWCPNHLEGAKLTSRLKDYPDGKYYQVHTSNALTWRYDHDKALPMENILLIIDKQ